MGSWGMKNVKNAWAFNRASASSRWFGLLVASLMWFAAAGASATTVPLDRVVAIAQKPNLVLQQNI